MVVKSMLIVMNIYAHRCEHYFCTRVSVAIPEIRIKEYEDGEKLQTS